MKFHSKFKSVFILFNIVVAGSFVFIFALPFFVLGTEFARTFWMANWALALGLLAILGGMDAYFFANQRLFALLEREDWPALVQYLEDRVIRRRQYSPRLTRLLVNTYLVMSDSAAVLGLEKKVAADKPGLLKKNALEFAVARILAADHAGAAAFIADRRREPGGDGDWLRWYHAFALLLARDFAAAADILVPLAADAKDPLVTALTGHFLGQTVIKALPEREDQVRTAAEAARVRVLKTFPTRRAWDREVDRARSEIHVVILSKPIQEGSEHIYATESKL